MPYNSPELPSGAVIVLGLAANTRIEAGVLVARNAAGNAVNASDAAGLRVIGRAEETIDNTGGLVDAKTIPVKRGIFRFENSTTNAVNKAVIGLRCFVANSTTVSAAGGTNNIVAGVVISYDADGVFIDTRFNGLL